MSGNDNNPITGGEHVITLLSAYIDGALDAAEHDFVRSHLEGCDACRAEHAELITTRAMLRVVPAMQAPRSFTLTPEMARKVRPPSLFDRIFRPSNAPSMAMGSALTFVLLFFVLLGGALSRESTTFSKIGSGLNGGGEYSAFSPKQEDNAVTMSAPAQAEATATTGASAAGSAPEVQGLAPQGTPGPAQVPPGAGGGGQDADAFRTEAPAEAQLPEPNVPTARQSAPASAPVDWGAALLGMVPLFLLALGLGLAAMAWLAGRNRPL